MVTHSNGRLVAVVQRQILYRVSMQKLLLVQLIAQNAKSARRLDKVRYFCQYPWINNTSTLEAMLVMVDMLSF
jgi:hypothetical protein